MSMSVPFELFPVPSLPPSRLSPGHSPGISPESTEALQNVLKDNHVKWHIFFNDLRYHNHAAHRAIAAWSLGADANIISKAYERDCEYERPTIKSPELISLENFNEHLGDDRYFGAYIRFFVQRVKEQGIGPTIEEFVFAPKANLDHEDGGTQPQMLNRFFAGVLHPLIHTGFSAEFSLPGMLVEGLAQVAVHHSVPGLLEPLLLFEGSLTDNLSKISLGPTIGRIAASVDVPTASVNQTSSRSTQKDDPHALTILARVLRDPKFHPPPVDRNDSGYDKTINQHSGDIASYVNAWNIDPALLEDGGWETKVEELVWTVVVLYGIAGWTHGRSKPEGFFADFFFMHLITSSLFLPSLCALISPVSRSRLLKTYLAVLCVWAVARGQPKLDVKGFLEATKRPDLLPVAGDGAPLIGTQTSGNGDLWDKILEEARVNHDEHVTKIIRSLAGWSSVFGTRRARLPLKKKSHARPGLSIDAASAVGSKERENGEDDFVLEDADLSPRSWREWKNGALSSPTLRDHSSHSNVRRMSNDPDLSPRSWRDAVNEGDMALPVRRAQSERPQSGSAKIHNKRNEADYLPSTELPGSEYLDGSLFLRVAVLTLQRMGWDFEKGKTERQSEGKDSELEEEFWDFTGFF